MSNSELKNRIYLRAFDPKTGKSHVVQPWYLERADDNLKLVAGKDEVMASFSVADAILRIHFPSFWASRRYIVIEGERDQRFFMEPEKVLPQMKEFVAQCLVENRTAAIAGMKKKASRDLVIGIPLFLAGLLLTGLSYLISFSAVAGGQFWVTTGLLGIGLLKIGSSVYWNLKAEQ